jgi:hypothetical protein
MKKNRIFLIISIILAFFVFFVFVKGYFFSNKSSEIKISEVSKVGEEYILSSNQLYHLYYLLNTQKLIENNKKFIYQEKIKLINPALLLNEKSQALLFDIWLYVNLLNEQGLLISEQHKEAIISILNSLQNENGVFTSNFSEASYGEELYNYLFPTKLAMDIYELIGMETPNKKKRDLWINNNLDKILKVKRGDFVSNGGFLYLIKYIQNKDGYKNNSLNKYLAQVVDIYTKSDNSAERIDTALNLNKEFSFEIFKLDKNEVAKYLESIQLEMGAFSLFWKKKYPDAMTTFISVNALMYLNQEIPRLEKLILWVDQEIQSTLVSIKN